MDSPDNIPAFDDPMISDGCQDHHYEMGSPMSVYDQVSILWIFSFLLSVRLTYYTLPPSL